MLVADLGHVIVQSSDHAFGKSNTDVLWQEQIWLFSRPLRIEKKYEKYKFAYAFLLQSGLLLDQILTRPK